VTFDANPRGVRVHGGPLAGRGGSRNPVEGLPTTMSTHLRLFPRLAIAALTLAGAMALGASGTGAATNRTTISFAEAPGANPNYIFPYLGCAYASTNNINQFQNLMFRPLYWFGLGSSADYVPSLSLATTPKFTNANRTVTIKMKGWRFADGEVVSAKSVMFFLNMYKADPTSYCGYNAGYGIPDQVASASGHGLSVTITFTKPVNANWLLYNYLSEITPMAQAWDRSSASQSSTCATGAYGAASTDAACKAVEAYLAKQSTNTATYTGALWQRGVDGPWRLTSFDAAGNATFQPNPHYSGPQRPQVRFVKEVAYTSVQAEESDLLSGKLSVGYIDPGVLTSPAPTIGRTGANWVALASRYDLVSSPTWGFNFAAFNFSASDPRSPIIDQLYVRQALQYAVDQTGIIKGVDKGYGTVIDSPLPPLTPSTLARRFANPYPFNVAAATTLLSAHGWSLVNGVQTCTVPGTGPGQCGANIAQGTTLSLNVVWTSGSANLDQTFATEIASWQALGVQVSHSTDAFNNVIGDCSGAKGFEICDWGSGWTYPPSYYPSGEALFMPGGVFNVGSYSDAHMTSLIRDSIAGSANLSSYALYAAQQLPVLYQPQATNLYEVVKNLKWTVSPAPNVFGDFMPEYSHP